jgi:type IV secretion system protein VirB6
MMALVTNSLRATLVLMVATSMAIFGSGLHGFLTEDVKKEINLVVTGDSGTPEDNIDKNLAWMQVGLSSIDGLDVMGDPTLDNAKTRAMWFVGLGTGGPAIVGGTMLLLYEVALALFIGLGPIFILCLLFDQTKQLFSKWLYYGIGTMFSMAVLSAMVSIALEMVTRVAASFWATAATGALLGADFTDGMTSQAMQQGGMGLILTTLIMTTPPMAAAFFQGTLGQFTPYGAFGQGAAASSATSYPPGQGPVNNTYTPRASEAEGLARTDSSTRPRQIFADQPSANASPGQRGLAQRGET